MNVISNHLAVRASGRLQGLKVLTRREEVFRAAASGLLRPIAAMRGSLAARISLAASAVAGLLLVLGAALALAMTQLTERLDRDRVLTSAALASAELTASIADSRYYAARFAVSGAPEDVARTHSTLDGAKQRLARTKENAVDVDAQAHERIEWLQVQVEGFESEIRALESAVAAHGPSDGSRGLAAAIALSGEQLAGHAREVEAQLSGAAAASRERLDALGRTLAVAIFGLLAGCIVVAIVGATFVARTTAGSIRRITRAMTGLAAGNRDVGIPGTDREDEIGEMARALVVFRDGAEELAAMRQREADGARDELARHQDDRERRSALMREVAERFERTVGEVASGIASASEQLQATAGSMADAANDSALLSDSLSENVVEIAAGVTAASAASEQFALSIGEISRQAAGSAAMAQDARASAQDADGTIGSLAEAVGRIGEIVHLIRAIADRTSLLSLNASIEAARGGEAGRGFAVVAAEIKDLAAQTSAATDQVSEQIQAIRVSTGQSVDALQRIGRQVHEMESSALAIAQAVDEQSLASQDLARNLSMAAGGANEIGASTGQVREMTGSTGAAATQVHDSATDLHRQAHALRAEVQRFLGYVRAA